MISLGFLLPGCVYIYLYSSDLRLQFRSDKKSKGEASWKLFFISIVSIFIAIPVMYFSVKDAIFV